MDSVVEQLLDGSLVILGDEATLSSIDGFRYVCVEKKIKKQVIHYSMLIDLRLLAMVELLRKYPDLLPVIDAYVEFAVDEAVDPYVIEAAGASY